MEGMVAVPGARKLFSLFSCGCLMVVALALVFPLAGRAWADDASLGRLGGGVQPLLQAEVQMLEEVVRVKVTAERSEVEATFTLLNQGPAEDLLVGFPQALEQADPQRSEFGDDTALHDFKAWVRGREVPVQLEKAAGSGNKGQIVAPHGAGEAEQPALPPYPVWYTFPVSLAAGEKAEVRNTYWVKNTAWSNGEVETGYILRSGSTWAGPIGRGRVEMVLDGIRPYQVQGARPGNWRLEKDNTYVWEFADWEPDKDITLHFQIRPSLAELMFWLPEIDALLRGGRYEETLPLLARALEGKRLPEGERQALLFRMAIALQEAGRLKKARELWEANLNLPWLQGRKEGDTRVVVPGRAENQRSYRMADEPAAYYYLAEVYRRQGDLESLSLLYHRVIALRLGLPLQRWMGLYLPVKELATPEPSRLNAEVQLKPEGAEAYPALSVSIEDRDGDFSEWSLSAWTIRNGGREVLEELREEPWYGQTYAARFEVSLPPLQPGEAVYYQIDARDGAGNLTTSGTKVWTFPESEEAWGKSLGEVEVEGRLVAVSGPEGTRYELAGYYLKPLNGLETAAGYLLRVRGEVTDRVMEGLKVLKIKELQVLDKGEGGGGRKLLPEAGAKENRSGTATGADKEGPMAKETFPRREAFFGNLVSTGPNLRLELAAGRQMELPAPGGMPESAGSGGLVLVSGSWMEAGVFKAERVVPLSGDLEEARTGLHPYFNPAPELKFILDNRGVEYASPPGARQITFRSVPFMLNYTTFVDALELTEILGLSLGYHPGSGVITWEGRARPLKLSIGRSGYSAYRGPGQPVTAVLRYKGKLYVPLRFVLEHYGYQVEYDAGQKLIHARAPFVGDAPAAGEDP